jgi:hypothetical protein
VFIPAYRDGLRASVLRHSTDAYVGYLKHHQYCPATIRAYLHSIVLQHRRPGLGNYRFEGRRCGPGRLRGATYPRQGTKGTQRAVVANHGDRNSEMAGTHPCWTGATTVSRL